MHVNQIKLHYVISYSIPITVKSTFRPFSALWQYSRSSRPEVFCKKGVLRNFIKFTGKYLCQSLFFNKVACLRPATLIKLQAWGNTTSGCFCLLEVTSCLLSMQDNKSSVLCKFTFVKFWIVAYSNNVEPGISEAATQRCS